MIIQESRVRLCQEGIKVKLEDLIVDRSSLEGFTGSSQAEPNQ